mmetsp:Transcript_128501/g.363683  ORF Transcript_128501/g.363683 Transcript_128501/m.363683 type:complete len:445 (-) Transcript_128501:1208-2542(-)
MPPEQDPALHRRVRLPGGPRAPPQQDLGLRPGHGEVPEAAAAHPGLQQHLRDQLRNLQQVHLQQAGGDWACPQLADVRARRFRDHVDPQPPQEARPVVQPAPVHTQQHHGRQAPGGPEPQPQLPGVAPEGVQALPAAGEALPLVQPAHGAPRRHRPLQGAAQGPDRHEQDPEAPRLDDLAVEEAQCQLRQQGLRQHGPRGAPGRRQPPRNAEHHGLRDGRGRHRPRLRAVRRVPPEAPGERAHEEGQRGGGRQGGGGGSTAAPGGGARGRAGGRRGAQAVAELRVLLRPLQGQRGDRQDPDGPVHPPRHQAEHVHRGPEEGGAGEEEGGGRAGGGRLRAAQPGDLPPRRLQDGLPRPGAGHGPRRVLQPPRVHHEAGLRLRVHPLDEVRGRRQGAHDPAGVERVLHVRADLHERRDPRPDVPLHGIPRERDHLAERLRGCLATA